ncbi:transposase [Aidingimonas halophila]|uniref:transposase n=1 Tax=Aidingimonas halophila TaxID=574349 RepID=UPI001586FFD2
MPSNVDEEDPYTRYYQAYKDEVRALADHVGASAAARELGLQPSQLYQWRTKAQQQSASAREQTLAEENARLKRHLAEKSEELEIAKSRGVLREEPEVKCTPSSSSIVRPSAFNGCARFSASTAAATTPGDSVEVSRLPAADKRSSISAWLRPSNRRGALRRCQADHDLNVALVLSHT